ncbi:MAG TPA: hypothetical protein VF021_11045 [Longimicrobiales bacterium]
MVGLGRFAALVVLAGAVAACGTTRVSPKAFDKTQPAPAFADVRVDASSDAEPVVVAPEVIEGWEFLYRFITETEFVLCLEGSRQDGKIVIDGFRLARMETTSVNSVRYQPCTSPRYVGTAHNHPPVDEAGKSLCYQSEPDRRSFGMDPRASLDIVLCGDNKYLWVLKDGRSAARTVALAQSK